MDTTLIFSICINILNKKTERFAQFLFKARIEIIPIKFE